MLHFSTTKGDFTVELYHGDAPVSAQNFLDYAKSGHFEGTVFHRVIPDFMIQGGGLTADMKSKKTNPPIKNEATNGLKNRRGTLSMARTNDINSATSQFFVNLKDNAFLDNKPGNYGYAVFGRIVDGMDVIDAIAAVETGSKAGHDDVPVEPIVVNSVKVVEDKK